MKVAHQGLLYELQITHHARSRMIGRHISDSLLVKVIEEGERQVHSSRENASWIFLSVPERSDNLICASIVIEGESLVIKTILVNWRLK